MKKFLSFFGGSGSASSPSLPETQQPVARFGSMGGGDGQFNRPWGIACNSRDDIIVADSGNHRIQVFDRSGKFLFKFGANGTELGQFKNPTGLAIDQRNGNQIIVSDTWNGRIQVFDEQGNFIRTFKSDFNGPQGIVLDPTSGNFLVVDNNNHQVQVFNPAGQVLRKFGSHGVENGQLMSPVGIGRLSNGHIVVGECDGDRLQVFDATGAFIRAIGICVVKSPCHIWVDREDRILVADFNHHVVQIFDESGRHLRTIGHGQLCGTANVCVDSAGRILVCENGPSRITIF